MRQEEEEQRQKLEAALRERREADQRRKASIRKFLRYVSLSGSRTLQAQEEQDRLEQEHQQRLQREAEQAELRRKAPT